MKKIFVKALSLILVLAACGSMSSCAVLSSVASSELTKQVLNSDLTKQVLTAVLQTYVNGQGTTYNYSGNFAAVVLKKGADGQYAFVNGKGTATTTAGTCPLIVGQVGTITLPAITADGGTMSDVALGNLTIGGTQGAQTLTVADNTTGQGTLAIDGKTLSLSSVYVECKYDTAGTMKYDMSVYFGENLDYAVNVSFEGKVQ